MKIEIRVKQKNMSEEINTFEVWLIEDRMSSGGLRLGGGSNPLNAITGAKQGIEEYAEQVKNLLKELAK